MTQLAGPVDGRTYSLVKDCDENGGNLAIVVGPPQSSQDILWRPLVATGPPALEPTMSPLVREAAPVSSNCNPTVLMRSGDFLYPGKRVVDYERGLFLIQQLDGNVQVRWGSPEFPGDLLWESGFIGDDPERSYYTKFEANSNLITWEITPDKSFAQAWEVGTYRPVLHPFYFVVDCIERNNIVAVYQGHPTESTSAIVWAVDPLVVASAMPFPRPTIPPTIEPTSSPTVETSAPTVREVEIDPNRPTSETVTPAISGSIRNVSLLSVLAFVFLSCVL
jgi:hypothetical protein